jgi:hypothetical protein
LPFIPSSTGQYQINQSGFQNPVGNQAPAWQSGMNNYLGATTQFNPNMLSGGAAPAQAGDLGNYNQVYGQQQGLANQYQGLINGTGPSLANLQAQQQGQANLQNQLSALGSARGSGNPALAQYQAQQAGGNIAQQTAQNAVMGRTQEELGAMQGLGGLQGQMQQGALGSAQMGQQNNQFNSTLGQQNQQFNAVQYMNQQQLANAAYQNYINNLSQQNLAQYQGNQNLQQLGSQQQLGYAQLQNSAQNNANQSNAGLIGSIAGAAGGLLALSDRRLKTNIYLGKREISRFMETV